MSPKFTEDESELLKAVLSEFVVRGRTGEVGILHGADRFISTHICLKKKQRETLKSAYKKLGISNKPNEVSI